MLPHSASCRAQFPADLSGSAVVNQATESGAWSERPPRPPNSGMKGGAPRRAFPRPQLLYKATPRHRVAD